MFSVALYPVLKELSRLKAIANLYSPIAGSIGES